MFRTGTILREPLQRIAAQNATVAFAEEMRSNHFMFLRTLAIHVRFEIDSMDPR